MSKFELEIDVLNSDQQLFWQVAVCLVAVLNEVHCKIRVHQSQSNAATDCHQWLASGLAKADST